MYDVDSNEHKMSNKNSYINSRPYVKEQPPDPLPDSSATISLTISSTKFIQKTHINFKHQMRRYSRKQSQ